MEISCTSPASFVKLLQKRSLDGLHFNNPGLRFYKDTISSSQSLYKRDLLGHFGCVNAIEFSSNGELIASGGDDRRLLIWNVWKTIFDSTAPACIETQHISNINSCSFDCQNKTVATGGSDGQVIIHDLEILKETSLYDLTETVFCLSPDPVNATNIATASDDGQVLILDTRLPVDSNHVVIADLGASMHSVMFNPAEPRLLATANSKHGIALWDVRKPKHVFLKSGVQNCMSVSFNSQGDQLLVLRRRGCPVIYDMKTMNPICKFDYQTYYNACTLKSASFAGLQEEFVMSGSDDFCIYLWKIPNKNSDQSELNCEPHMILKGHRSIVNQVRYCPRNQMILSSGVEKLIKMWTPYALPGSTGRLLHARRYGDDDEMERNAYSHEEYIHMVLRAGSFLSHDYSNGNTDEEPCMIAFFDSLIQREVEQSTEDSDYNADSDKEQKGGSSPCSSTSDVEGNGDEPRSAPSRRRASPPPRDRTRSNNHARQNRPSNRNGEMPGADDDSSSDSASEVDEILSAMYSRYMHSRDQTSSGSGPTGKKISCVIAQRKYKDRIKQHCVYKPLDVPHRLKVRTNGDFYPQEDSSRTMSVLADVLDNFVDNLVGSDGSSNHSLSDTNDGGSRAASSTSAAFYPLCPTTSFGVSRGSSVRAPPLNPATISSPTSSSMPSNSRSTRNQAGHSCGPGERELYYVPELEAISSSPSSSSSDSDMQTTSERGLRTRRRGQSSKSRTSHSSSASCGESSSKSSGKSRSSHQVSEYSLVGARPQQLTSLPFTLPGSRPSTTHHINKSLLGRPNTSSLVNIKEKKPVFYSEDSELSGASNAPSDKTGHVKFKKVNNSKGRKFRKHKRTDSSSSSENEDR